MSIKRNPKTESGLGIFPYRLIISLGPTHGGGGAARKYPRVKAISPDRIPAQIRKTFKDALEPCPDPESWLASAKIP